RRELCAHPGDLARYLPHHLVDLVGNGVRPAVPQSLGLLSVLLPGRLRDQMHRCGAAAAAPASLSRDYPAGGKRSRMVVPVATLGPLTAISSATVSTSIWPRWASIRPLVMER